MAGGALPTRLTKAIKDHGHVIDSSVPAGKGRQAWISTQLKDAPVHLDRDASELLSSHLGDELGHLRGILDALGAAYGEGERVNSRMLQPFLGTGGVPAPWELTDAIDSGDTETAMSQLHRMLDGQRHPLVVMATLQRHFGGLLQLDGAGVTSEAEAASVLGVAPYPAKKAMTQCRKLGSQAIARAIELLAAADVDLRGASGWPDQLVLEVLVARLCKLRPLASRR